jgi:hypothetical protein
VQRLHGARATARAREKRRESGRGRVAARVSAVGELGTIWAGAAGPTILV